MMLVQSEKLGLNSEFAIVWWVVS